MNAASRQYYLNILFDATIHPLDETAEFLRDAATLEDAALWSRIVRYCSIRHVQINVHYSLVYHSFRSSAPTVAQHLRAQPQFADIENVQVTSATRIAQQAILSRWDAAVKEDRVIFEYLLFIHGLLPHETWER
ncbi:hypothetical protein FRC06_011329 [Ceratobasidium sp. 370]|nr:hypothetical protein FRC06_011329 [Ceratobasidium sp. 370]